MSIPERQCAILKESFHEIMDDPNFTFEERWIQARFLQYHLLLMICNIDPFSVPSDEVIRGTSGIAAANYYLKPSLN